MGDLPSLLWNWLFFNFFFDLFFKRSLHKCFTFLLYITVSIINNNISHLFIFQIFNLVCEESLLQCGYHAILVSSLILFHHKLNFSYSIQLRYVVLKSCNALQYVFPSLFKQSRGHSLKCWESHEIRSVLDRSHFVIPILFPVYVLLYYYRVPISQSVVLDSFNKCVICLIGDFNASFALFHSSFYS